MTLTYISQTLATFSNTSLTTPATTMAAALYSTPFDISQSTTFVMQFIWTGTPTGTLTVMGSVDGVNYNISLGTHSIVAAAGTYTLDLGASAGVTTSCQYIQAQYSGSGTGALTTVTAGAKR